MNARIMIQNKKKQTCNTASVSFICFYFLMCSAVCLEKGPRKDTYGEAINQCSKLGTGYKLSDPIFGPLIKDFKNWNGLNFWLPYRRVVYDNYSWVDGTQADFTLNSMGHYLGYSCGAIDLENGHYDFQPCHQEGSSFICQIPGCSTCPSIAKSGYECLVLQKECFTYHCGSANWYRARQKCIEQGGDLAVVKDMLDIALLHQFWDKTYDSACTTSWVGLSREKWKTQKGGEATLNFWCEGEPKVHGNCSIISVENFYFSWRAAACNDKHLYYCAKDGTAVDANIRPVGEKSFPKDVNGVPARLNKSLHIFSVFIVLAVIGLQIYTIFVIRKKGRYKYKCPSAGTERTDTPKIADNGKGTNRNGGEAAYRAGQGDNSPLLNGQLGNI